MAANASVQTPIVIGSPAFMANPAGSYAWLRKNLPVGQVDLDFGAFTAQFWVLSRYEDCRSLLSDSRLKRSPQNLSGGGIPPDLDDISLVTTATLDMQDDDAHRRLRSLVTVPFTPARIEKLCTQVSTLTVSQLDFLAAKGGPFDLRSEFALPITLAVIAGMLGLPETQRSRFQEGVTALLSGFSGSPQQWQQRVADLVDLTRGLVAHKRTHFGDDIVTDLIRAEECGDRLKDHELVAMVFSLLTAGYETTYNLITNSAAALLMHRDQLGDLLTTPEDGNLWRSTLDEVGRYMPPISGTRPLTTVEAIEVNGVVIPSGQKVMPLLAAANRDPDIFADPDVFDIRRKPNHHLGFGHGAHFCLGANLAKMETRVALKVLFDRYPNLDFAVDSSELILEPIPLWTRFRDLPVNLEGS